MKAVEGTEYKHRSVNGEDYDTAWTQSHQNLNVTSAQLCTAVERSADSCIILWSDKRATDNLCVILG